MIPMNLDELNTELDRFRNEKIPLNDVERFSPNVMDNASFWRDSIEKFGHYPLCGAIPPGVTDHEGCIYYNLLLAMYNGAYNLIDSYFLNPNAEPIRMLEIGAGLGTTHRYLAYRKYGVTYCGIDINRYIDSEKIFITDGQSIPRELGEDFDYVFSCNVFQHLSPLQRAAYYREAWRVLSPNGKLTLSFTCTIPPLERRNGEDEKSYLYTCGQYTEMASVNDVLKDIQEVGFNILFTTVRYLDGFFTVHAIKPET